MMQIPILCYHSHIISSADYAGNGHLALAHDLALLAEHGKTVVPLSWVIDALIHKKENIELNNAVVMTFDDGSKADFLPIDHPEFGPQPGLYPILLEHARQHPQHHPNLHASSFVIASDTARLCMDQKCLFGLDWMTDDWWPQAEASGMISIESHSWDHNNAVCEGVRPGTGDQFYSVNTYAQASHQIRDAAVSIAAVSGRPPEFFAYPYGHVNNFLEQEYFPGYQHQHRMRCALTTRPKYVTWETLPWSVPRFVHGEHWRDPGSLINIINGQASIT